MGLSWSSATPEEGETTLNQTPEADNKDTENTEVTDDVINNEEVTEESDESIKKKREEDLVKFKEDLATKREQARKKIGEVSEEIKGLKDLLQQEVAKRRELEEELSKYKSGGNITNESSKTNTPGSKLSAEVESLRISNYEDDDDEIDILEEDDKGQQDETSDTKVKSKRKGLKKKVSFSLDLVKEEQFESKDSKDELVKNDTKEQADDKPIQEKSNEEQQQETDMINDLQEKNKKLENQVKALKDVTNLSKQLLGLRESQVEELNDKLLKIEDKEKDYERKMNAMKELRKLYDERGRALIMEHKHQLEKEKTKATILEAKLRLAEGTNEDLFEKSKHLEEKVKNIDNQLDSVKSELSETKIKLATEKESLYHASSQISLINNLVSQIISGPELDLDHLARFLEDNHSLIKELTAKGEIDYVASALVGVAGGIVEIPKDEKPDIAENLGKVWRVLVELLSHHKKVDIPQEWDSCYKSVDTPKGPKLVISVSQTFIKLKDLILEKNSLVKEVGRLEKLNEHLEHRMEDQGNRLTLVTEELHNTWDVVNKLKKQHDSLHTHERILKHELQHKRSMLNGLKKQLETCREQWALAREKNSKTENDWMLLRAEFASRKQKKKLYNSAESGYEDEETQSPEYDTDDDKSIEIEEESPENSVNDNINPTGSLSPSEVSTSESNSMPDDCNGPISEILDGIFDEACKIAKSKPIPVKEETIIKVDNPEEIDKNLSFPIVENTNFTIATVSELDLFDTQVPSERISFAAYCDYPITRLEQIPEVEEDISNETSPQDSDELKDKLQIISVTKLKNQTEEKIETQEIKSNNEVNVSTSQEIIVKSETGNLTTDEILKRREERLKRMEESCKSLFIQMGQTSNRGTDLSNKLDQIHAIYGPQESSDAGITQSNETQQSNDQTESRQSQNDTRSNSDNTPTNNETEVQQSLNETQSNEQNNQS